MWSTGTIGLCGISYYAINQWAVAALQPPHLSAMIPWEGAADFYRDFARHGGIQSNGFLEAWYPRQIVAVQHGNPEARIDPWLGERASGPDILNEQQLASNRSDSIRDILNQVPFLSAVNWAGFGLHPRGNFEAFMQAASRKKWLECHPGRHEEWFYLEKGMALQRRFLDHFLKDADNGWDKEETIEQEIVSLPPERPTVGHLRMFLSDLAMKYHSLATAALNGDYHTGHAPFFTINGTIHESNRLRALIHSLNTKFSDNMRDRGES
ncbi:hypothetical protein LTR17_025546 [Elasticomyces elasticus]|nr:hypothetical protein LTR17_025546 [Elasticomyces elasticus]